MIVLQTVLLISFWRWKMSSCLDKIVHDIHYNDSEKIPVSIAEHHSNMEKDCTLAVCIIYWDFEVGM